jgi:hypothetical protein
MRYLLALLISVCAIIAQGQQINPVPDYVFQNRMSVGRTGVTDTAAYFSVGPRYGAIRGMMPPMVVDTALVTGNKRNGLFIFSIQKNKYLYWDSVGVKWAEMSGTTGSALTSGDTTAMLLPYLRKADTTAMLLPYLRKSDTVWLSNRINLKLSISDTSSMLNPYLRGSGTANYFPKFDASRSVINSKLYESGTNLLFNTTNPSFTSAGITTIENNATSSAVYTYKIADTIRAYMGYGGASTFDINNLKDGDIRFYTSATLRGRFQTDGTFRLNSLTGTGSRIVTADADGVLSATSSATGLVDTTVLSTRAWRQKGIDSVSANVALKVNISDTASMLTNYIRHAGNGLTKSGQALSVDTAAIATRARVQKGIDSVATLATAGVTSVATGYGLSGGTITTTGTISADTLQLSTRSWRQKGLDSLAALEISGSGTNNYVPKFTDTRTVGNSQIFDNGTNVLINTTTAGTNGRFQVNGDIGISGARQIRPASNFDSDALTYLGTKLSIGRLNSDAYAYVGSGLVASTTNLDGALLFDAGRVSGTSIGRVQISNSTSENVSLSVLKGSTTTFLASSNSETYINTTTDAGDYKLQVSGNAYVTGTTVLAATSGNVGIGTTSPNQKLTIQSGVGDVAGITMRANGVTSSDEVFVGQGSAGSLFVANRSTNAITFQIGGLTRMNLTNDAELYLNTTTDAGDYKLQVSGNAYVTGTTVLAATSGNVAIGTASTSTYTNQSGTLVVLSTNDGTIGDGNLHLYSSSPQNTNIGGALVFGGQDGVVIPRTFASIAGLKENNTSGNYSSYLRFGTRENGFSVTEKMRITSVGIVAIGTNSPNASAQLDVTSTTRGFLPPRMTTTQRDAISSPAAGLVIYNTTDSKLQVYTTAWTDLH